MVRPNDTGYIKAFGKGEPFPYKAPIAWWMRFEYSRDLAWVYSVSGAHELLLPQCHLARSG